METQAIQKNNPIRNAGHMNGSLYNSNQNNSNSVNMHDNFDEIRPEITPDGYGLRTPYNTHLNLDFLKYCETIAHPQQNITNFRRQRNNSTSSRHMRHSMNVPNSESLESLASEVSIESASDLAEQTLMETRRRMEAYRSFRTKRKPPPTQQTNLDLKSPKQIVSPTEKGSTSPVWASRKALPVGDMLSSINALPPDKYKNVREQLVVALHRLRDLENEVKKVPVLQLQVSSLRGEKVELINTVKRLRETNTSSVPNTTKIPTGPPPVPPKRRYRSIACHVTPETMELGCQACITPIRRSQSVQCIANACDAYINTEPIASNTVAIQAIVHKEMKDQAMQCFVMTSDSCVGTPAISHTSISTQIKPVEPTMHDSGTQSAIVKNACASTSTVHIVTCDNSTLHRPESIEMSTNTDAIKTPKCTEQSTNTVYTELADKMTYAGVETCDSADGNHILMRSALSGPDYQTCNELVDSNCQTEHYLAQTQDSCIGNHVEQTSKCVGEHLLTQEACTSATVAQRDQCVGESVDLTNAETQCVSIERVHVGILATQPRVMTADASAGLDYVIEHRNSLTQCTPLSSDATTQATTSVTTNDTTTETESAMLGGNWVADKAFHDQSTSASVDVSDIQTNTPPIETCEKSSIAKPLHTDAPIQVSVCTNTVSAQYESSEPLPHSSDESEDYLTIDKRSQNVSNCSVSTDTEGLSEQTNANSEIEQYVEKVSSLIEEQQSLINSKFGGLDDTQSDEEEDNSTSLSIHKPVTIPPEVLEPSNAIVFKKFVPTEITASLDAIGEMDSTDSVFKETNTSSPVTSSPIKSIMRKPGSVSTETKTLRFAEGVKSDDSDTSSDEDESDTTEEEEEFTPASSSNEASSEEMQSEEEEEHNKKTDEVDAVAVQPVVEPQRVEVEITQPETTIETLVEEKVSCITETFLHACDVMDQHMKNPWAVSKEEMSSAQKYLEEQWMTVACQKSSSSYQVEEFVDKLSEISCNLIMKVVNLTDANGNTALHFAISHENVSVVSTLLDIEELNVNKYNKVGYTPTMLASIMKNDSEKWFHVLCKLYQRADVNAHAKQGGETALMLVAMSHGKVEWVNALLEAGASVNAQDYDGSTALMCAAEQKQIDFVRRLLAHPSTNLNIKDNNGDTAYDIAMTKDKAIGLLLYAKQNFGKAPRSNAEGTPVD